MIVEVLKLVEELISLSNATIPHMMFMRALISCRFGISLPVEIDFSFGMRLYKVLITDERGGFPIFMWERGRYMLLVMESDGEDSWGSVS